MWTLFAAALDSHNRWQGLKRKLLLESEALGVEKDLGHPRGKVSTVQGSLYNVSTCSSPNQICTPTVMGSSLPGGIVVCLWTARAVGGDFLTPSPATLHFSHVALPLSLHTEQIGSSFLHTAEDRDDQVLPADVLFLHSVDESRPDPAIRPLSPERARL